MLHRSAGHCCKVYYVQPGEDSVAKTSWFSGFWSLLAPWEVSWERVSILTGLPRIALSEAERKTKLAGSQSTAHAGPWTSRLYLPPDTLMQILLPQAALSPPPNVQILHVQVPMLRTSVPDIPPLPWVPGSFSWSNVLLRPTGPGLSGLNPGSALN